MKLSEVPSGRWVVAVSGGVDSVVLLQLLVEQAPACELIVAHADHGIRPDSAADARFVEALAMSHNLAFELETLSLGNTASEERARHARWAFLRKVVAQYNAKGVITAHHADDVVETIVLNLLRGTGWRGLCSLRSTENVLRPLIGAYKQDIVRHAAEHQLEWYEDETNQQTIYTRNRIRRDIIPRALAQDSQFKDKMRGLWRRQCRVTGELETALDEIYIHLVDGGILNKPKLMSLEPSLALEVLRHFLLERHIRQTIPQLKRALDFARTAENGKFFSLNGRQFLAVRRDALLVSNDAKWYHKQVTTSH